MLTKSSAASILNMSCPFDSRLDAVATGAPRRTGRLRPNPKLAQLVARLFLTELERRFEIGDGMIATALGSMRLRAPEDIGG